MLFSNVLIYATKPLVKNKSMILQEKDKNGYTLLHYACYSGNISLINVLLERKWKNEANDITRKTPLKIAEERGHAAVVSLLQKPEASKKTAPHGMGMIAFRQHVASPSKVAITKGNTVYSGTIFPKKTQPFVRPGAVASHDRTVFVTPTKGTQLFAAWAIYLNIDDPKNSIPIRFYAEASKAAKKLEVSDKGRVKKGLEGLKPNNKLKKIYTPVCITKNVLAIWEKKVSRNQNTVMGGHAAAAVAEAAGFPAGGNWEWCHLIAHSLGGQDGTKPISAKDAAFVGPQQESNLVVGTAEVNSQMIVVETIIKNLINHNKVDKLFVKTEPTFAPGLEGYHIADKIKYTIQDDPIHPKRQITFTFDALSRQLVIPAQLDVFEGIMEDLFVRGKVKESLVITNIPPLGTTSSKDVAAPAQSPNIAADNTQAKASKFREVANFDQQLGWNCFDVAAGINRDQLVDYALSRSDRLEFRRLLAPEIKHALMLTAVYLRMVREGAERANDPENAVRIASLFKVHDSMNDISKKIELENEINQLLSGRDEDACYLENLKRHALPESMHNREIIALTDRYYQAHAECNKL